MVVLPSVGPAVGFATVSVIAAVAPRTNTAGLWVASSCSGCGTSSHGPGGAPGYASGTYGTGAMTAGIGSLRGTSRAAVTCPAASTTPKQ